VVYSESFVGGTAADTFGHGTQVAGIIAGCGVQSTGSAYFDTVRGGAVTAMLINPTSRCWTGTELEPTAG
jgi:hypothetical protein